MVTRLISSTYSGQSLQSSLYHHCAVLKFYQRNQPKCFPCSRRSYAITLGWDFVNKVPTSKDLLRVLCILMFPKHFKIILGETLAVHHEVTTNYLYIFDCKIAIYHSRMLIFFSPSLVMTIMSYKEIILDTVSTGTLQGVLLACLLNWM